jgi:anti-anti-sigma factor
MSEEQMIQVTQHGELTVVHPGTEVNERSLIVQFSDQLLKFVQEAKPAKLQVNFEYVKFFSTEAILALIRTQRAVSESGAQMNLCGLNPDIRKLFKLYNLDGTVFKIFDSCKDAAAALENA